MHPADATVAPSAGCPFSVLLLANSTAGTVPLLVRFNVTVSAGTPDAFDWTFGDGGFWNASGPTASNPVHRYSVPGSYVASVSVDEAGCRVVATIDLAAVAGPLATSCVAHPPRGAAPLTVTFACSVSGGSGTYISALWEFGDGGRGSGLNVAYTFVQPGQFTSVLNVTDSGGHWAIATVPVSVSAALASSDSRVLGLPAAWFYAVSAGALVAAAFVIWAFHAATRRSRQTPVPPTPANSSDVNSTNAMAPPAEAPARAGPTGVEPLAVAASVPSVQRGARSEEPIPREVRPPPDALRLTERLVIHLGRQGRLSPDQLGSNAMTQAGIGSALGVGQNSVTNVLRRLDAAGIVRHELRHVKGRGRRVRVYSLTGRGEVLYQDLRRRPSP